MRHTRVEFISRPKKVSRHVQRVARGTVGKSVGGIVNSLLEKLVDWPLGLESFLPLDFFCHLSEIMELAHLRLIWLVFQLFRSESLAFLRSDCVGLGRVLEVGTDFPYLFDFSDKRELFEDVELSSDGSLGLLSATEIGLLGFWVGGS